MIHISIKDLGKKFGREWVFRHLDFQLSPGKKLAITGNNGSGKTTLLKVIAAIMPTNEGTIAYSKNNQNISAEDIYKYISLSGPYTELIEEFTLIELIRFHHKFRPIQIGVEQLIARLQFSGATNKPIKVFSSGMKQKLKLGLAFFGGADLLLLDEPTSNFDARNIAWFREEIQKLGNDKTIVICSNQRHEYDFCDEVLNISQ